MVRTITVRYNLSSSLEVVIARVFAASYAVAQPAVSPLQQLHLTCGPLLHLQQA